MAMKAFYQELLNTCTRQTISDIQEKAFDCEYLTPHETYILADYIAWNEDYEKMTDSYRRNAC
jgi:hypothetical protein